MRTTGRLLRGSALVALGALVACSSDTGVAGPTDPAAVLAAVEGAVPTVELEGAALDAVRADVEAAARCLLGDAVDADGIPLVGLAGDTSAGLGVLVVDDEPAADVVREADRDDLRDCVRAALLGQIGEVGPGFDVAVTVADGPDVGEAALVVDSSVGVGGFALGVDTVVVAAGDALLLARTTTGGSPDVAPVVPALQAAAAAVEGGAS